MHRNKLKIFGFMMIGAVSCITPFEPEIRQADINKYVVSGLVTDAGGFQHVSVSMATPVTDPSFKPVSGCTVVISDEAGNRFPLSETAKGSYSVEIDSSGLLPGKAFRVQIAAPDGTMIESDFDTMPPAVDVDSVYFLKREIIVDPVTGKTIKGIQFFLNLDAGKSGRFFRWEAEETWEYRVQYPREWYYDGTVHHIVPPDYSRKICWMTVPVKEVFTLTTTGLAQNRYEKLPLNFVDNYSSGRLLYGYSLLVRQFNISESTYSYWDQVKINSSTGATLYQKQPLTIAGNLHNITSPGNEVLGYFEVSSVRSKRIFVRNVEDMDIEFIQNCSASALRKGFRELTIDDYPAWLFAGKLGYAMIVLGIECVDCLSLGGTNIKPYFWPW